MLIPFISYLLV